MTTNLAGGGGTGSHMKIDLNPEDWFTISPLGLSEDDALNKLGMPWLGTTYWVNYDWAVSETQLRWASRQRSA